MGNVFRKSEIFCVTETRIIQPKNPEKEIGEKVLDVKHVDVFAVA